MKKLLTITFLAITYLAQAQELPSIPANGFAFPLGSKFVINLIPTDSVNFDYSVLSFEPFEEIVDTRKKDDLFEKKDEDNTIAFYFCLGTNGETEQEREKNRRVLLIMKNYSKEALSYTSEIQREEDEEYEETSNVGTFSNATGTETWPYMIYSIGLREFRKFGYATNSINQITVKTDNIQTTIEADSIFTNRLNLIFSDLGNLRLNDVRLKEQEWGGVDNMPDYNCSIGESYYPNSNKYEIDTFRVYLYESSLIENSITYYATKESGLIRVIFFEWEEPFLINQNLQAKADEIFRNKLKFLEDIIVQEAKKHIEYKDEKNYIDRIWKTSSGFTISLENMKNFNRIKMVIYKD
jgi:hypothetical protein